MQNIKINNIIIGEQFENSENYQKFLEISQKEKMNVNVAKAGSRFYIEKDIYFMALWPSSSNIISDNVINNNSLVFKLIYRDFSILFTGDIEEVAEESILKLYKGKENILKADVLKVAHHRFKNIFYTRISRMGKT